MSRRNRAVRHIKKSLNRETTLNNVARADRKLAFSWTVWLSIALALAVLVVYAPVRNYGFVDYDDDLYVSVNQHVQQGLTWAAVKWAFTSVSLYYWQPLTWLSHMLDLQLFGSTPGAFHMMNAAIHAVNSILLFLLLKRLTQRLWRSAIVAGLFGLHPLRVESVAWIAERKDVLSAFFALITLWAYVLYVRRKDWIGYLGVCLTFCCALMCKPTVVALPVALLLLDYWPLRRFRAGERFPWTIAAEKLPLLAIAGVVSLITVSGQVQMGATQESTLAARFGTAVFACVSYLRLLLWPEGLAVIYPYSGTYPAMGILACVLLLVLLTVGAIYFAKRYPFLCFGWFWYLVMLLPMSGLIRQAGPQAMADRFTYLPAIGLLVAAVWFVAEQIKLWPSRNLAAVISAGLILCLLGAVSANRVQVWKDSVTLFGNAVSVAPQSAVSQHNLGYGLAEQGRYTEAIPHYRVALELDPKLFRADYNLGRALYEVGKTGEAATYFERTLDLPLAPEYEADVRNALGIALVREGEVERAKREFERAVRLKPDSPELYANLGSCFATQGDLKSAIVQFRMAIQLKPGYAEAHRNLGIALSQEGLQDNARSELKTALRFDPADQQAEHLLQVLRVKNKP